ncbi:hypothetical protein Tco_0174727 [Tanacetum coccineum]
MITLNNCNLNIKLLILKNKEVDIWLGDGAKDGKLFEYFTSLLLCCKKIQAVEKEMKAKNILMMAIPKEHMRRFHGMDDAKEIWEAIRTRFGAHGAEVINKDAIISFLDFLPPAWSNLAMTMRTNPEIDTLSIDDLYNNLRVFEQEIQVLALLLLVQTNIPEKEVLAVFCCIKHTELKETITCTYGYQLKHENQANPHAGASEVTNSAGTSQTPSFMPLRKKHEDDRANCIVPSTVRNTEEKAESRKSSTNSKKEEILTELQQEKKASSTDTKIRRLIYDSSF